MKKTLILTLGLMVGLGAPLIATADMDVGTVMSSVDITIYGYIKADASYDTQQTQGDLAFFVNPEKGGEKDNEFNMTARQTRLGLKLGGPELGSGKVSARLETDFYGQGAANNKPDLRMRLAYVQWASDTWSIRAGQDWDTLLTVFADTVNFGNLGDSGRIGYRRAQLILGGNMNMGEARLTAKVAAARTIGEDLLAPGQDDGADAGFPTVEGALIVDAPLFTEKPARISVSGHFGRETLDVEDGERKNDDKDYDTWSLMGSLRLPITEMVAVQGSIWTGENLDNYYGGIGQGINTTLDRSISAMGGWAQLLIFPTENIKCSVGYGLDDPDTDDLNDGQRSKNQQIFVNAAYNFTPAFQVALEYINMKTDYKGGDDAKNNRVQGAVVYKF